MPTCLNLVVSCHFLSCVDDLAQRILVAIINGILSKLIYLIVMQALIVKYLMLEYII